MSTILDVTRPVIGDEIASLLVSDVRKKFTDWTDDFAQRGVEQLTGFLAACSGTATPLGPSKAVDEFWHAFILRTAAYADFCERIAGRFIHHVPDDDSDGEAEASKVERARAVRRATVEAMGAAGFEIDEEFWPPIMDAGKCTQCHQGCYDSKRELTVM